ncbi:unnamed protein product [Diamesa serratosioi]
MRFLKPLLDEVVKNINFKLECPFKKGMYEIKSMPLPDIFIPPFIPTNTPYKATFDVSTRFAKKAENLAVISFDWEITSDLE